MLRLGSSSALYRLFRFINKYDGNHMTFTFFSRRRLTAMLALTAAIALLTACGQKGPLTLPGKEGSDTREVPTTTAPATTAPTTPTTTE